jgi:hypothetical protein
VARPYPAVTCHVGVNGGSLCFRAPAGGHRYTSRGAGRKVPWVAASKRTPLKGGRLAARTTDHRSIEAAGHLSFAEPRVGNIGLELPRQSGLMLAAGNPETLGHLPQHPLKFERVDTVRLHHGPDNGIGQDPVERRFAMTIHRWALQIAVESLRSLQRSAGSCECGLIVADCGILRPALITSSICS